MITAQTRKALIRSVLHKEKLDLIIRNVQVVNVHTGRIDPAVIGIKDGCIVHQNAVNFEADQIFDGKGFFAIPGFIDGHVHLDSTLMIPENLTELIVPCGTTTMLADPMEISNVAGKRGLEALLHNTQNLPYRILVEVSSRVPTAPGLETTGGELDLKAVKAVLKWDESISLGELDPSKVLGLKDEYLEKVEAAHRLGKIANGHAAGLTHEELTAYACGGLADDHECVDYADALERVKLGLAVMVREGSTERNLEPILSGALRDGLDTRFFLFCTDDKHPDDILHEGHIDYMVRKAIKLGVSPIHAIQMATINAARHFHLDHILGSLTPGRYADIILTESIENIQPQEVFYKGRHVSSQGKLSVELPIPNYPKWIRKTVKLTKGHEAKDYQLSAQGETAKIHVIELYEDQIINRKGFAELPVKNAVVQTNPDQDILKLAVVERYGKNGNIGLSFVKGLGMKKGAIASSVSHDHHNIVAAGVNDEDIAVCVKAIEKLNGGLAIAADGKLLGSLALPIGGLMSELPSAQIITELEKMNSIYQKLGGKLPAPFMTISFISLPTVPEFGLTDRGLIDVRNHKIIPPIIE
jgi:adenine deaminase